MTRSLIAAGLFSGLLHSSHAGILWEVTAQIDGRSQLHISGETVQWVHLDYLAPGYHTETPEPTVISTWDGSFPVMTGLEWLPTFDPGPNSHPATSDILSGIRPLFPQTTDIAVTALDGRGTVSVLQMPAEENGYTTIIEFDDNVFGGHDHYTIRLATVPEPTGWIAACALGLLAYGGFRRAVPMKA